MGFALKNPDRLVLQQYIDHGPSRIPVRRLLAHGIAAGNFDYSPFRSYDPRRLAPLIKQLAQLAEQLALNQ